jgi:hypothetical protein
VIKYGAKEVGEKLRRWVAEQLPGADVLCLSYQQGLTVCVTFNVFFIFIYFILFSN